MLQSQTDKEILEGERERANTHTPQHQYTHTPQNSHPPNYNSKLCRCVLLEHVMKLAIMHMYY